MVPALSGQTSCSPCKLCGPNANVSGVQCHAGSPADVVVCVCNSGFYGNGLVCTACKVCDSNAVTRDPCYAATSVDTVKCKCNAEFYGDGVTCSRCKQCANHSSTSGSCTGEVFDRRVCTCEAGYFGPGDTCNECLTGYYSSAGRCWHSLTLMCSVGFNRFRFLWVCSFTASCRSKHLYSLQDLPSKCNYLWDSLSCCKHQR